MHGVVFRLGEGWEVRLGLFLLTLARNEAACVRCLWASGSRVPSARSVGLTQEKGEMIRVSARRAVRRPHPAR